MNTALNTIDTVAEERATIRQLLGITEIMSRVKIKKVGELHTEFYQNDDIDAPIIFALPGLGLYSELSARFYDSLCKQGFHVVAIDPNGHGYSDGERGTYQVDLLLEEISDVIDFYSERFNGDILMFGYSIGSPVALAYTETDDRVKAVAGFTLLVPQLPPDAMHMMGWNWIQQTAMLFPRYILPMSKLFQNERLKHLDSNPVAQAISQDPLVVMDYPLGTLSSLYTYKHDTYREAYNFSSLIIQGNKDQVVNTEYARRVQNEMEHEFDLIEVNGDHFMGWSRPDYLAEILGWWYHLELKNEWDIRY